VAKENFVRERKHRLNREAYRGQVTVMFTMCERLRRPTLAQPSIVSPLVEMLSTAANEHNCIIPVYTFMPDHLHILVRGVQQDSDTIALVDRFKSKSGWWFYISQPNIRWQKNYDDRVVKEFEGCANQAWYIANNPCRAGLVEDPFQWPFTGSVGMELHDVFENMW
jgi:putative transposase